MPDTVKAKRGLAFRDDDSIQITIATNAGACFGVVRAIKLGYQAVDRARKSGGAVYSLGQLIHNPHVVSDLAGRGVVTVDDAAAVGGGTVVLRSHGVRKEIEVSLRAKGVAVIDATCPLVKKPQRIAQSLGEKGYFLIVVGDANHPEIRGVVSYFGRPDYLVTYDARDVAKVPAEVKGVGVLAQTTIEVDVLEKVAEAARRRFDDVLVYNTICDATSIRQTEADRIAGAADVVIVVGGKNSSNTTKLVKICRARQKDTYHVEDLGEIERRWFDGKRKIAVTGGASTPHEFVDRAGEHIASLLGSPAH